MIMKNNIIFNIILKKYPIGRILFNKYKLCQNAKSSIGKDPTSLQFLSIPYVFLLHLLLLAMKTVELSYSEQFLGKCRWFYVVAGWQTLWHEYILINQVCPKHGDYPPLYRSSISPACFFFSLTHSTTAKHVSEFSWIMINNLFLAPGNTLFLLFVPGYF